VLPFEILYNEVLQRVPDEVGADAAFSPAFVAALRRGAACGVRERADYFGGSRLSVAVHVRRGDVTSSRHTYMRLPDTYYLELIRTVRALVPDAAVHVFSSTEGNYKPSDFDAYTAAGASVHLDGDPTVAWSHFMRGVLAAPNRRVPARVRALALSPAAVTCAAAGLALTRAAAESAHGWFQPWATAQPPLAAAARVLILCSPPLAAAARVLILCSPPLAAAARVLILCSPPLAAAARVLILCSPPLAAAARVLILSKGTFSSIAAYFNTRGCVIHPPTDSMVRRDEQRLLSRWLEPDETLEVQLRECLRDQAGAAGVDDGAFEFAAQDGDETAKGPPEYSPSSE